MRPIIVGLVVSVLGGFSWVLFSLVFGISAALSGQGIGAGYWNDIYLAGIAMLSGIPAGIVGEVVERCRANKSDEP